MRGGGTMRRRKGKGASDKFVEESSPEPGAAAFSEGLTPTPSSFGLQSFLQVQKLRHLPSSLPPKA